MRTTGVVRASFFPFFPEFIMPIVKLTPPFIANGLTCPDGKSRVEWCCADTPGLYIEVRANRPGHGTYYLRYKDATGKTCHQKIGRTDDISLADARKQAKTLKAEIALGADPRGEAKRQKEVPTLDEFFTTHYLPFAMPRKRSWRRDEELYRLRIAGKFGHLRLNQLTRQAIQTFHTGLLDGGLSAASADHHIKLIRRMLNLAIEWDLLDRNPIKGIALFNQDNKVEHYLNDEQLERLLTVLREDENRSICRIAMFLLSTGCRLNEALQGTWTQIDRKNRVWRIPALNSKSKRMRSVPLNDSALHILDQLDTEGTYEHLFINHKTRKPYANVYKVWTRIRDKAGLPHLRLHDLRHGFASLLISGGRTLYEVQQILGHSDPKVTMRYAHLSSKALQEAARSGSVIVKSGDSAAA